MRSVLALLDPRPYQHTVLTVNTISLFLIFYTHYLFAITMEDKRQQLLLVIATLLPVCLQPQLASAFSSSTRTTPVRPYSISTKIKTRANVIKSIQTHRLLQLNAKTDEEKEEEERKRRVREEIFWAKQRALAAEMGAKSDSAAKK